MSDQPLENVDAAIDDAREAARRLEMGEGDITTDDTDFSAPDEQPRLDAPAPGPDDAERDETVRRELGEGDDPA